MLPGQTVLEALHEEVTKILDACEEEHSSMVVILNTEGLAHIAVSGPDFPGLLEILEEVKRGILHIMGVEEMEPGPDRDEDDEEGNHERLN